MVEVEICYRSNPTEPELVSEARIFGAPSLFNMYKSKEEIEKNGEEIEKNKDGKGDILFCNDAQIVDFINYVFRPHVEFSPDSSYKLDYVYDKEILGVVWVSTKKFDKTTALAFSKWLNKQNIDFLLEEPERKLVKGDTDKKIRRRHLNVLNSVYYAGLVKNIVHMIPKHHAYINQLKNDGYHVVGYCRKSKTQSSNRATLLQRMVDILRQSSVKESFYKRDFNDQNILSELDKVNGNTQDFLTFIQENDKVCVVALDYAGLTTNMTDLKNILRNNPKLQKIIIDLYCYENQFKVFDREQLLNNVNDLKLFNCRPNYRQRSK
ncbi:hypothetical protein BD770DRAFT_420412 [Pilaira anomala]|nr:hypothetical protein BD770DRAFT_420412 [Pilaira anomala]